MLQKMAGGGIPADAVAQVGEKYYNNLEDAINASSSDYPAIMINNVTESGMGYQITKDGAVLKTNGYTLEFVAKPYSYIDVNKKFTIIGSGNKDKPDVIVDRLSVNGNENSNDIYLTLDNVYLQKAESNYYQDFLSIKGDAVLNSCVINFYPYGKDKSEVENKLAIIVANSNIEFRGNNKVFGSIQLLKNSTETTNGKLDIEDGTIKKYLIFPAGLIGGKGDALSTVRLPEGWEWVNPTDILPNSEYDWHTTKTAKYKIPNDGYDYSGNGVVTDDGEYVLIDLRIYLVKSNKWEVKPSIDDWTYGETAKEPVGESLYGDVEFTYKSVNDDNFNKEKPSKPGNYLMRAYVAQNDYSDEYTGLEKIVPFTIHKAIPFYTVPTGLSGVEGEALSSVKLTDGFSWKDPKQLITKSGVYEAVYTPEDTECYETVDVEINIKMLVKPVIKGDDVTVELGGEFDPLDYVIANDETDGDLSNNIEIISNNVDTSKPGVYEITYKVTNSLGVFTIKTIKVEVLGKVEEKPEVTPEPTVKPTPEAKPQVEAFKAPVYDDGGPFTTDECGSVYDRWGNLMWKAPSCKAQVNDGYSIVNTSDR